MFYQLHDIIYDDWTFTHKSTDYKIKMSGDRAANDGELVRRWCVAGKGLAIKSCLDMSNDLLSGGVLNVMHEYKARSTELWLICPSRQSITPAVRLLRDMLREKCKEVLRLLAERGLLDKEVLA